MMTSNGNYPAGAQYDPNAHWNQPSTEDIEVEVTVSLTISKTLKVRVPSIDGKVLPKTDSELKEAVIHQRWLPHEIANIGDSILKDSTEQKYIIEDLSNWVEDNFEVVLEDTPLYYGDDDSRAE
jgi:hypothetical protein